MDTKVGKMDTKALVVGQDVYMFNDHYPHWFCGQRGKVVKVTPNGVDVQTAGELLRFDNDGYELDVSRRDRLGFGPSPEDKFYTSLWQSAPEFAPWHLDDMPFAERTALLEQKNRELKAVSEQKDRDFKALLERAAQTAQGGGSTKITCLGDFLTIKEFELADRMWRESEHDYASRIAKRIIEPNIARINAALGQENSPMYLAYVVEYTRVM
jgi:hypothetical protein